MAKLCDKYDELIELLVAGELDENTAAGVMAHIEHCPVCREKYEAALAVERFLTPSDRVVPPGFARAVASTISARARSRPVPSYVLPEWSLVFGWILIVLGGLYGIVAAFKPEIFSLARTVLFSIAAKPVLLAVVGMMFVAAAFSVVFSLIGVALLSRRY